MRWIRTLLWIFLLSAVFSTLGFSETAPLPLAPPRPYHYEVGPATKQAIGTAYEPTGSASPLWFTLTGGRITELFYPSVDEPQLGELQFIVTDGKSFISQQRQDTLSEVRYQDEGLVIQVHGRDQNQSYTYSQEIFSDSASPALRIRTHFRWLTAGLRVFIAFKPTIHGQSARNFGEATSSYLLAGAITPPGKEPVFATLMASTPWRQTAVALEDSFWNFWMHYFLFPPETRSSLLSASSGNLVLLAELQKNDDPELTYELALGFGPSPTAALTYAHTAMSVPFDRAAQNYSDGWKNYLHTLDTGLNKPNFIQSSLFARRSAQMIKMHENKRSRGAFIERLSAPATVPTRADSSRKIPKIRIRDSYRGALGLLAAGDTTTPVDTLRYLIHAQNQDGSWRTPSLDSASSSIALDEVAFPILLTAQLSRFGLISLNHKELEMIRKSVSYLLSHGPATALDPWDSIGGYLPSTLAIEIAALRSASQLTGDPLPNQVADEWQSQIERWTLTQNGPLGKNYYLRGRSNLSHATGSDLPVGGMGPLTEDSLIDGGFLDLVRYAVRDAHDTRIINTVQLYDRPDLGLSNGLHYHRHPLETSLWPILAAKRGIYAVQAGDFERARAELHALESVANENGLLPAQTQAGLEVACPWIGAHSEAILLHRSIEEGSALEQTDHPPSH